jgi:antitoxin component YwqK of YwqJK toxin-antitoxin module
MKYLTHFLFLSIFTIIFGEIVVNAQTTGNDTTINFIDINGNKQGKWIKYYDNEQVRYTGFFIDDKPQGTFKHYHPNGELKAIQDFEENGDIRTELFWDNGNIAAKGKFNSERKKNGLWHYYYESGELHKTLYYLNGIKDGKEITYYKNGEMVLEFHYQNDIKEGAYTFYFDNGIIREKGFYHDNMKNGEFTVYYPDGSLDEKGIYRNHLKEGKWILSTPEGTYDTVMFVNGERTDRDSLEAEFFKKMQWAKENQDKFKQPEDYLDNPFEFFKQP